MTVRFPATERARKYGYVIWPKSLESDVRRLLQGRENVQVMFAGVELGTKRVDWNHCRISVGKSQTGGLSPEVSSFELASALPGHLEVRCV